MGNYAVRIYDAALQAFVQAEAKRRRIQTSDVVEDALRRYRQDQFPRGGSDVPADAGSELAHGLPVRMEAILEEVDLAHAHADVVLNAADCLVTRTKGPARGVDDDVPVTPIDGLDARHLTEKIQTRREKGPDSGPDDTLGF